METEKMVKQYDIRLAVAAGETKLMVVNSPKDKGKIEEIRNRKQEIIEFLRTKEKQEKERYEERIRLISRIEGLSEIENARTALAEWHEAFNASFDDVGGLGVGPKPEYDFTAALKKYPRAAAYLKAKEYAEKTNHELYSIGKKALEEVIYGDYEKAMTDMESELKDFKERHAWD